MKKKSVHAEVDAITRLPVKPPFDEVTVIVARRTMEGISRPCSKCRAYLCSVSRRVVVFFTAAGLVWREVLQCIRVLDER